MQRSHNYLLQFLWSVRHNIDSKYRPLDILSNPNSWMSPPLKQKCEPLPKSAGIVPHSSHNLGRGGDTSRGCAHGCGCGCGHSFHIPRGASQTAVLTVMTLDFSPDFPRFSPIFGDFYGLFMDFYKEGRIHLYHFPGRTDSKRTRKPAGTFWNILGHTMRQT